MTHVTPKRLHVTFEIRNFFTFVQTPNPSFAYNCKCPWKWVRLDFKFYSWEEFEIFNKSDPRIWNKNYDNEYEQREIFLAQEKYG
jgi:hypothetical protein